MKFSVSSAIGAALALVSAAAQADGNSATASAMASATVIAPISLSKVNDLAFGKIVADSNGGTVDSETGATGLVEVPGSGRQSAQFNVTGDENETYDVSISPSTVTLQGGDDAEPMSAQLSVVGGNASNRALTGGTDNFKVKGVLTVGSNQAAGNYNGDFNVTVAY